MGNFCQKPLDRRVFGCLHELLCLTMILKSRARASDGSFIADLRYTLFKELLFFIKCCYLIFLNFQSAVIDNITQYKYCAVFFQVILNYLFQLSSNVDLGNIIWSYSPISILYKNGDATPNYNHQTTLSTPFALSLIKAKSSASLHVYIYFSFGMCLMQKHG